MKELTEEDLQHMTATREQENHEVLNDVPLEKCDANEFEMPETAEAWGDFDIESYAATHPFIGRRKLNGHFEILGANEVLVAAREQGIKQLGTLSVADYGDEKWLMMSYFTRKMLSPLRCYHLFIKSIELDIPLPFSKEGTWSYENRGYWKHCMEMLWLLRNHEELLATNPNGVLDSAIKDLSMTQACKMMHDLLERHNAFVRNKQQQVRRMFAASHPEQEEPLELEDRPSPFKAFSGPKGKPAPNIERKNWGK